MRIKCAVLLTLAGPVFLHAFQHTLHLACVRACAGKCIATLACPACLTLQKVGGEPARQAQVFFTPGPAVRYAANAYPDCENAAATSLQWLASTARTMRASWPTDCSLRPLVCWPRPFVVVCATPIACRFGSSVANPDSFLRAPLALVRVGSTLPPSAAAHLVAARMPCPGLSRRTHARAAV